MGVIGGVIASNSSGGSVDLSTTVILAPTSSSRNVITPTGNYVPLTIQNASGQTANSFEILNSAGTYGFKVSISGTTASIYGIGRATYSGGNTTVAYKMDIDPGNNWISFWPGGVPYVNMTAYGTAFAKQIMFGTSDYITLATMDCGFTRNAAGIIRVSNASTGYGSLIVGAYTAATVPLTIFAAASQTASALEIWNSASTSSIKFTLDGGGSTGYNGMYATSQMTVGTASEYFVANANGSKTINSNGVPNFVVNTSAVITGLPLTFSSTAYVGVGNSDVGFKYSASGILKVTDGSTGYGSLILGAYSAATIALTVKGAVSQSANLLELQDSGGTSRCHFNLDGYTLTIGRTVIAGYNGFITVPENADIRADGYAAFTITKPTIVGNNASAIPLTVKGYASQSANLQEWQNSSATVLSRVNKNGVIVTKVNSAPADGDLAANECSWYFDSTNGSAFVRFKGKTADGTVVTGSLALT